MRSLECKKKSSSAGNKNEHRQNTVGRLLTNSPQWSKSKRSTLKSENLADLERTQSMAVKKLHRVLGGRLSASKGKIQVWQTTQHQAKKGVHLLQGDFQVAEVIQNHNVPVRRRSESLN